MIIKKATKQDLGAVQALVAKYGTSINPKLFNKRDIALQARLESGELIGFMWGGLMAADSVMCIDSGYVDPEHVGKGIHGSLYVAMFKEAVKRGVTKFVGSIQTNNIRAIKSAMRAGVTIHPAPHFMAEGNPGQILSSRGL